MIPVWKGSGNQWDCDEMGHMNVRVYVEKMMEGLGVFASAIGMPHAFKSGATSTLIPADQHIRYIREVRPGEPLTMTACVLDVGETDAVIYQDMRHVDGRCAAAFRTRVIHAEAQTGSAFPWSRASRAALEALVDTPPEDTAPRSVQPDTPVLDDAEAILSVAERSGARQVGLGTVPQTHSDVHGRMAPHWVIGRISDSVPNLLYEWRQKVASAAGGMRIGAAVLEYRIVYRRWPKAGDLFEVRSAFGTHEGKTHSLFHWVLDPVSGMPWATTQAVAITLDLEARKAVPAPPELIASLKKIAPGKLGL